MICAFEAVPDGLASARVHSFSIKPVDNGDQEFSFMTQADETYFLKSIARMREIVYNGK